MGRTTLFDRLLQAVVATEEIDPRSVEGGLLESERQAIEGAVARRIEQFTAGRVCARRGLERLGVGPGTPVPQGADRAPVWPDGFVGSITHTNSWCAAAVARASEVRAIGIDLEPSTPLKESIVNRICTPAEREWLSEVPDSGLMAKIVFSAKEAIYKCQYPLTGEFLGFQAVALRAEDGVFRAVFQQDAGQFKEGDTISGRYLVEEGVVATSCTLRAE